MAGFRRVRVKIPQSDIEERFRTCLVARLATLNPDGSPHQVPIVFTWVDDCFWSPIDGKPKENVPLQRVVNARSDSRGSLLLDEYDNNWTKLWWIRIDVQITVIEIGETPLPGVLDSLVEKYPQYEDVAVLRDPGTILRLTPKKISSWQAA